MNVVLPRDLPELFAALAEPGARVLAGGTDLLVRLRAGRDTAGSLVGLDRLEELRGITEEDSGRALRLGAAATHAELLDHPLVRRRLPVLAAALETLGSPPVRNMGTLGGNLCTASPAGDCLPPLHVLGAEAELLSAAGTRRLALPDFVQGPGRTALGPGEILAAVRVPLPDRDFRHHFEKVARRDALAVAVVSLAALLRTGPGGKVLEARLAWGSVAPTVWRCPEAEAALVGRRLGLSSLRRAASLVRERVRPIDDLRAGAAYRREVAGNLLLRLATL